MSSRRNRARDERGALRQTSTGEVSLDDVTDAIFGTDLSAVDTNYSVTLSLDQIKAYEKVQVRVEGLDQEWVQTLINILENGGELVPIEVFQEGDYYILADGFHRYEAYKRLNFGKVKVLLRSGGYDAALERAEEANLEHGLQLSMESKREILLRRLRRNHTWAQLSNREIARRLGISAPTVGNWIDDFKLSQGLQVDRTTTIGADGKKRDTSNISKHERPKHPVSPSRAYHIIETLVERDGLQAMLGLPMEKRRQLAEVFSEWAEALMEADIKWSGGEL